MSELSIEKPTNSYIYKQEYSAKKKTRICLINPPASVMRHEYFPVGQPRGIAYIAAVLEQNEYEVLIIDALAEGFDRYTELDGDWLLQGLPHMGLAFQLFFLIKVKIPSALLPL